MNAYSVIWDGFDNIVQLIVYTAAIGFGYYLLLLYMYPPHAVWLVSFYRSHQEFNEPASVSRRVSTPVPLAGDKGSPPQSDKDTKAVMGPKARGMSREDWWAVNKRWVVEQTTDLKRGGCQKIASLEPGARGKIALQLALRRCGADSALVIVTTGPQAGAAGWVRRQDVRAYTLPEYESLLWDDVLRDLKMFAETTFYLMGVGSAAGSVILLRFASRLRRPWINHHVSVWTAIASGGGLIVSSFFVSWAW